MRGRYLKAAERACAAKARFDTAQEAERACEYRYRAYRCPVCHAYHLTSQGGPAQPTEERPAPEPPLATLRDARWTEWKPRGEPSRKTAPLPRPEPEPAPPSAPDSRATALVREGPDRNGRFLLLVDGRLVKSARVPRPQWPLVQVGGTYPVEGTRLLL